MWQLAIELNGVEREFTVSPIQATMILHFDGRGAFSWHSRHSLACNDSHCDCRVV